MAQEIPNSRSYTHRKCGEVTEVDGGDFKNMAAPVPGMPRTMCAACGGIFPTTEFKWEDSGEEITAYYERHRQFVPASVSFLCSRAVSGSIMFGGFLAGIALGVWIGMSSSIIWGVLSGLFLAPALAIGIIVVWDAVSTRILSNALNVPDVRCLK